MGLTPLPKMDDLIGSSGGGRAEFGPMGSTRIRCAASYRPLFSVLDNFLGYPAEFIDTKSEGTVRVWLYFDSVGSLRRDRLRSSGGPRPLQVYVLRTILAALKDPLPLSFGCAGRGLATVFVFELNPEISTDDFRMRIAAWEEGQASLNGDMVFHRTLAPVKQLPISIERTSGEGLRHGLDLVPLFSQGYASIRPKLWNASGIDPLQLYRLDPLYQKTE